MPESRHSVFSEGTDAGLLGGSAVALWFLARDLLAGHPLRTPSVLGELFIYGNPTPDLINMDFGAVVLYTAVHYLAFVMLGLFIALLVRQATAQPVARFAILVLFVAFEFCFVVVIRVASGEVGTLFPTWTVMAANLVAVAAMAAYFRWRYPELMRALRAEPLGA